MSAAATTHLGDVASFVRGITFKPDHVVPVGSDGSVACMRTKNVQSELDLSDVWGIPDSFVKRADQYLAAGDLLVSSANSWNLVGKCCWVPDLPWRATFGGFISVLRADREKIEPRYLYHWFASPRIQATVRSFGQQTTNISNLNVDRCLRLLLPLPPLPEQRRIAVILDKADELRAQRKDTIAQLDTLTQSIFLDMFGDPAANPRAWPITTLAEVLESIRNGANPEQHTQPEGWPVTRIETIAEGRIDPERVRWTTPDPSLLSKFQLQAGDILFSHINSVEHIGKTALYLGQPEPLIHGINLLRLRPKSSVTRPRWLLHLLKHRQVRDHFRMRCKRAVNQASLNQQDIGGLLMILPPLELQDEFARCLDGIEELAHSQSASQNWLDNLFAALQHRAFRGDL